MTKALEGIKVVEIGAAVAMPIAGMLMGSWGADIVHVESPGEGDMQRYSSHRLGAWTQYSEINYLWEHVDRNKKSICINPGASGRTSGYPQTVRGGRRVSEQPAPLRDAEVQPEL
jgi:crotonobetainyl-CoA:carnitine CoA-transferase CaiB-like acyl-CoA transferase